ncbi:MAG: hypothetical protein DMG37_24415 [Acidobacteria bacterium]|nr:MAG: hypothetical protein DMG37_24415 [Acidobacteriota bacterium]
MEPLHAGNRRPRSLIAIRKQTCWGGLLRAIDPLTLQRYSASFPRRRLQEEFRFHVPKNLRGKHVLDIGCGDGHNSAFSGKARRQSNQHCLTQSIDPAHKKAEINKVRDATRFICSPVEEVEIPAHSFDVIWGDAILHHLIENLEFALSRLTLWAKPGALMLFSEPVNFNNALRRIRFALPVKTDATPDECSLEPAELTLIRRFVPDLRVRCYSLFGRFSRFIPINYNYERSSLWRRMIVNALASFEYAPLSLPFFQNLAGYAVFYGHLRHPGPAGNFNHDVN